MSKLSDFVGGGGGLKPFNDLGTVTGTVNLDVSEFGSFRVKQGAGAITLNVTGKAADTAGYVELFFYPNAEQAVTISGADFVENGYTAELNNIKSFEYSGVNKSPSEQDANTGGITFNESGTKFYSVNGLSIHQYSLSEAFNISTISYDFVELTRNSTIYDGKFNNDGSKFYVLTADKKIFEYNVSTAYDLSTRSGGLVNLDVSNQESFARSISFNNDGSKIFVLGNENKRVFSYTLSTNFSLSSASYDNLSFLFTGQDAIPQSIAFNPDGSKMYMLGGSDNSVYQYSLSTPFAVQLSAYDLLSFSVAAQDISPTSIYFTSDMSQAFIMGSNNRKLFEYSVSYDLFVYEIIHTGTDATFNTLTADYTIEDAT